MFSAFSLFESAFISVNQRLDYLGSLRFSCGLANRVNTIG